MVSWLGHAGVALDLAGTRVLADPVLRAHVGLLRRRGPVPAADLWSRPDVVVVSHMHHDHLDLPSLRLIGTDVPLVVPAGAGPLFDGFADVREVRAGDEVRVGTVQITAVPAHHNDERARTSLRAAALGYLIRGGGTRVWHAGDTGAFPGMADLRGEVDLALIPVGGWGPSLGPEHLDPRQAAEAVSLVGAHTALPIHWGTLLMPGLRMLRPDLAVRPGERFAQWASQLAGDTRVLLPPVSTSVRIP
jgi:L-ascorbate metabolism protein UlaG (beta-lactamase superfamily)